jgi:4-hydroxy-tetrahydrodipicolinate reductase
MKERCDLKIGLIGSNGRLGKEIACLCPPFALFTRDHPAVALGQIDLYIDVSSKEALSHNLHVALLAKKPIVIGTTGHETLKTIMDASQHIPIFYTPNFSLGMALMKQLAAILSRKFHSKANVHLTEVHHTHKKDIPSGSALLLQQTIEKHLLHPVKIESIRSEQIIGEHTLFFNTPEETLSLSHKAHCRKVFAQGAIAAAYFLIKQPPGLYGMDELLETPIKDPS